MAHQSSPAAPAHTATSSKKEFLLFISIPAGIIMLVILFLFVPSLFAKPRYDFVYTSCASYDCPSSLIVGQDGRAKQVEPSSIIDSGRQQGTEIYYHKTRDNSSRRIELAEAQAYRLNSSNVSPDGYTLTRGGSGGGFLLWGYSDDSHWYLKKGSLQKKSLNLELNRYYYDTNLKLVGWVEK